MKKETKILLAVVAAFVAIAACVTVLVLYREKIAAFVGKFTKKAPPEEPAQEENSPLYTPEEQEAFADI